MNKSRIIGLSMLILALFSTNCFASNSELKDYEINETISIENAEEFEKNIQKNINIDNVKYELQDVSSDDLDGKFLVEEVCFPIFFYVGWGRKAGSGCDHDTRLPGDSGICRMDGTDLCHSQSDHGSLIPLPGSENPSGGESKWINQHEENRRSRKII